MYHSELAHLQRQHCTWHCSLVFFNENDEGVNLCHDLCEWLEQKIVYSLRKEKKPGKKVAEYKDIQFVMDKFSKTSVECKDIYLFEDKFKELFSKGHGAYLHNV
jgi:hypothetical protein